MRNFIFNLLIFLFFIVSKSNGQNNVGYLEGNFDVSTNGQSTYIIPIKTLKGIGSIAPSLSLTYTSGIQDGIVGIGWNISGLSAITRGNQTIFHNGNMKSLKNNSEDNFYMNGDLLMPVSGNNGENGTVYSTHSETFIKIESFGGSNGNPSWWKVTMTDGSVYEYGKQEAHKINTGSSVISWHISSSKDVHNNGINYEYIQSDGLEIVLSKILYSDNSIEFNYSTKSNPNIGFINGKAIKSTKRLSNIFIKQASQTVFNYQCTYQTKNLKDFLTSVELTASDNISKFKTDFDYGLTGFNEQITISSHTYQNDKPNVILTAGDFNSNGRTDLIVMEQKAVVVNNKIDRVTSASYKLISDIGETGGTKLELTKSYPEIDYANPKEEFSLPFYNFSTDHDGIGRDGFLRPNKRLHTYKDSRGGIHADGMDSTNQILIDKFNSSGTLVSVNSIDIGIPKDSYFNKYDFYLKDGNSFVQGDFNGNGKADIVSILGRKFLASEIIEQKWDLFTGWYVYRKTPVYDYDYKAFFTNQSEGETNKEIINLTTYQLKSAKALYAVSFTGSGKNELMVFGSSGYNIYSIDPLPPSSGNSYTATQIKSGGDIIFTNYKRVLLGDFNGDGKTDILGIGLTQKADIFYSNGSGFVKSNFNLDRIPVFDVWPDMFIASDFNGDGITDLFHAYTYPITTGGNTTYYPKQVAYYFKGLNQTKETVSTFETQDICDDEFYFYYSNYPDLQVIDSRWSDFRCVDPWDNRALMEYTIQYNFTTQIVEVYSPIITNVSAGNSGLILNALYGSPAQTGDFDGDGKPEIIQSSGGNSYKIVSLFAANNSGNLKSVQDNLGNVTDIEYESLAKKGSNVYAKTQSTSYPLLIATFPVKVVKSVKVPDGKTGVITKSFQYKNATLNKIRGFLGFQETDIIDNFGNNTVSTQELNTVYNILYPKKTKSFVQGILVSEKTLEYSIDPRTVNTTRYFANKGLKSSITKTINSDLLKGFNVTTSYSDFDEYNNAQKEIVNYGQGTILKEINRTFFNSTTGSIYRIGLPVTESLKSTRGGNSFITSKVIEYSVDKKFPNKEIDYINGNVVNEVQWNYDTWGNVKTEKSSVYNSGNFLQTTYDYDGSGKYLIKETDPLGVYQSYNTYNEFGKPTSVSDHKGNTRTFTYDVWGRVESVQNPDGTTHNTTMAWASGGPSGAKILETESGTEKPIKKTYTDALGREIRTSLQQVDGSELKVDKEYDTKGRLFKVSLPSTSTPALWNTYAYDNYDRPISITAANGNITTYSYSANSVTETKNNISSTKNFDAGGNVTSITDPGGTITFLLRPDGQPSSVIAPGNIATTFEYDQFGRRTKIIDPSAGAKMFAYDVWGNVNKETDANNKITSITYDQYGRVTAKTTPELITNYSYNADGLLQSETSNNGTGKNVTYDQLGRTATFKETGADGKWLQKGYSYIPGVIKTVGYTSQNGYITTETNTYQNGFLKKVTIDGDHVIYDLQQINALGKTTKVLSGPITRNYTYDQYGMPTGRSAQSPIAGTYMNFEYNFNPLSGNLNFRKDVNKNITENFTYDNLNRLTGYGGQTVSYDDKGNITQKSGIGDFHYLNNSKPYALTGIVQTGNVIPHRLQQITYSSFNRPLSITEDDYDAQFTYEASGNRVKMNVKQNGTLVLNRYYLMGQYELDEKPGATKEKLYLGGDFYTAGAVLVKDNSSAWQVYYINSDYLGSVTHIVNSTGNLLAEYSYDAWGRLRNPISHVVYIDGQQPELLFGRGYTGHEHLNWFGLINMNARLYDPVHGRFLAPDPYVQAPDFTQSYNRYGYGFNNPMVYTDPDGEFFLGTVVTFVGDLLKTAFLDGGLDFTSKSARQKAWQNFDPTAQWSATNKAWKIDIGQFQTDPNRKPIGRILQLLSRFTWELPQTVVGKTYSHIRNLAGGVSNVDYYGGATLVNGNTNNPNDRWGVTLGSYINGRNLQADPYTDPLFRHEYGHTLQSRLVGPLYLTSVGIPSLVGQILDNLGLNDHNREWYETQANRMAFRYFDNHAPDVLDRLPWDDEIYPRRYNPNWYWIFSHPPLIFSWWLFF